MQLVVDIENDSLADKIIKILDVFKNDGVTITSKNEIKKSVNYSDEYLKENWKELVMTSGDSSDYYKSDKYYEDRGEYLREKYQ